MNNDTHTEERRQWVRDQQDMISIEPLAYEDLTLSQQCQLIDQIEETMGQTAEEYHQQEFDADHIQGLQTNALFNTLQGILDYSPNQAKKIIQNLQENWIVKACRRQ